MKTQLLSAMIPALPLLVYAQPTAQAPTVLRDRKGPIQAIEFSEKDAASSLSDQAFVKQYPLVTADDF
ncbi:MAG: hypothetical protein H7Z72_01925 [Bacteroidetes bacterium]|nr:hypothetical protein [Fibrella sp.]